MAVDGSPLLTAIVLTTSLERVQTDSPHLPRFARLLPLTPACESLQPAFVQTCLSEALLAAFLARFLVNPCHGIVLESWRCKLQSAQDWARNIAAGSLQAQWEPYYGVCFDFHTPARPALIIRTHSSQVPGSPLGIRRAGAARYSHSLRPSLSSSRYRDRPPLGVRTCFHFIRLARALLHPELHPKVDAATRSHPSLPARVLSYPLRSIRRCFAAGLRSDPPPAPAQQEADTVLPSSEPSLVGQEEEEIGDGSWRALRRTQVAKEAKEPKELETAECHECCGADATAGSGKVQIPSPAAAEESSRRTPLAAAAAARRFVLGLGAPSAVPGSSRFGCTQARAQRQAGVLVEPPTAEAVVAGTNVASMYEQSSWHDVDGDEGRERQAGAGLTDALTSVAPERNESEADPGKIKVIDSDDGGGSEDRERSVQDLGVRRDSNAIRLGGMVQL